MATQTISNRAGVVPLPSPSFERFGGLCAILAGLAGFLYAVAFIVLRNTLLSALCLLLIGLLSTAVLTAVYDRLRETDAAFALWALLLGIVGAFGSTIHGGYDLANAINPPPAVPDLPNPIDPRGLLTFGVTGIALAVVAWLMRRGGHFPSRLSVLGYATAILLLVLYLGRLIVLDATNPVILVPALLNGFIVNPAWYVWLGVVLWRAQ